MSGEQAEGEKTITLEELLARASELREYITVLSNTINNYVTQYRELQLASETLKSLPEAGGEGFVVVDRLSSVLVPGIIREGWTGSVLVNIGFGYYLKTSRDKAVEVIEKRIASVNRLLDELQKRYRAALDEYSAIQGILNQMYAEAQKPEDSGGQATGG
ncbi:ATP-binding protein [Thermosphaera chiliense]|uniref:ATP-binding protein n=1 Tax=Thermosphaera chiliense TaxID=3402707 RepID=A0A7M1URB3_9CREN|nr:prefoldin domain-containing protein [Thermosphaera aggregans]QOR94798.1 ATP-binding protein [Thermosphaera aggregans]